MSRRRRKSKLVLPTEVLLVAVLVLVIFVVAQQNTGTVLFSIFLGMALCLVLVLVGVIVMERRWQNLARTLNLSEIDTMSGVEFEHYVEKLMKGRGYVTTPTAGAGDLGVDLIVERGGIKTAVQIKRYASNVSRRAISDAVAAQRYYRCNRAMVVTNSYFTKDAEKLAQSTECYLVDREKLSEWVSEWQKKGE